MSTRTHVLVAWGLVGILALLNCATWCYHFQETNAWRSQMLHIIRDACERGAYPPNHPFAEHCRKMEMLRVAYQAELAKDEADPAP